MMLMMGIMYDDDCDDSCDKSMISGYANDKRGYGKFEHYFFNYHHSKLNHSS